MRAPARAALAAHLHAFPGMTALDRVIPMPRLIEVDHVDVATPPAATWEAIRHDDLPTSRLVRALFALRTVPDRLAGRTPASSPRLTLDALVSSAERPGFQILIDDPPHEVVVGAIGKVWKLAIPFHHVAGAAAYDGFFEPGWIKVAWALRVVPRGAHDSRVELEVRIDATDDESWRKFRDYFRVIGPGAHHVRRGLLGALGRQLGVPEELEEVRELPGDELVPDAEAQLTDGVTVAATPDAIWPWLVQMGCGRGGFYGVDLVDNRGEPSAREVHAELQHLQIGDVVPGGASAVAGFEVLLLDEPRVLVLGALRDLDAGRQLAFARERPPRFWQVTWAFVLEPLDETTTRIHVRARAAVSPDERAHVAWVRPVHHIMQAVQLRHLAELIEGRRARDGWRDVVAGLGGAARMALAMITPFARTARASWGMPPGDATRSYPGDELVATPRWGWTHGIEIAAPASEVWPWIAQIGADRGGFYSYQWLENLAGCEVRNAETIHPGWQVREGDELRLHPRAPAMRVVAVEPGRSFVAFGAPELGAVLSGQPWVASSWAFVVEPLGPERCRFVSRFRAACSDDLATRLQFGPTLVEPIGFAMDRRMLAGVKQRAERARQG